MSHILTVNGCHSDKIHRTKGIFQGTVLSPHLFNIFTDDLVRRLNPHYPERKTLLAYADDHVLLCNTLAEAKDYLNTAIAWANPRGLKINSTKSFILYDHETTVNALNNITIHSRPVGKYLGIPFTTAGIDWVTHFSNAIKEVSPFLRLRLHQTRTWSITARHHLYRTFVRPTIDYGLTLFAIHSLNLSTAKPSSHHDVWHEMEQFHHDACRLIARQKQPNRLLAEILGEPSPLQRARETALRSLLKNLPFTTDIERPTILEAFNNWNTATPRAWPTAFTIQQRLHQFLKEQNPLPDRRIPHQLDNDSQHHLLHWRKKTFGYGKTCVCGDRYNQHQHSTCLPEANITSLLHSNQFTEIENIFSIWWAILTHQ